MLLENVHRPGWTPDAPGFVRREDEDIVVAELVRPHFRRSHESFAVLAFDASGRLCAAERVDGREEHRCTMAAESWRRVAASAGNRVWIAHNHPSGIAQPSAADIESTRTACEMLRFMALHLHDHLIVVGAGHFSFRRAGLL